MSQLTSNLSYINAIKSDIKSAIEAKGVDMTGYSFPDYPAAISQISAGGNLGYIFIDQNGFYDAVQQGVNGFSYVEVSVPTGYFEKDVTERNYGIVTLNNSASYVASYAFYKDSTLTVATMYDCLAVGNNAFEGCSNLSMADFNSCSIIGEFAFVSCTSLTDTFIYSCQTIGAYAFYGCSSLVNVNLGTCPSLVTTTPFGNCTSLSTVSLPECSYISGTPFFGCTSLRTVYLGYGDVVGTSGSRPLPVGQGITVYVPSSLVTAYQANSTWNKYTIQSIPE